jgi:two-component system phosphate regulon sensor histidine kinase PhoR
VKGFGLGLSYVKNVIERHGGTVNLTSRLGEGTTLTFMLPFESHPTTTETS